MLTIIIPEREFFDEENSLFVYTKERRIVLEHSLVSISKWEAKWHKPFLGKEAKTIEETLDYIKCMTITQNVDDRTYKTLTKENIQTVTEYIEDPRTATWFNDRSKNKGVNKEVVTSELIYYWMVALEIPFECQRWHLNRLLTLIRVINIKNNAPKSKMGKREVLKSNAELNANRRKMTGSSG